MTDAHFVYKGVVVAALPELLAMRHLAGFRGELSLELFNRGYWERPAQVFAVTAIAKMKETICRAMVLLG